ncbi:DUF3054 domain-containing protein [Arthrobacter sp. UM1]|uniref:DUF3054 domain-containing protein n=1 Tax=Arthrobacter sp. UM1 TaxID=2766776 RepID=UPI001CF6523A|nr:DUF3054 domain-containing protein [Arthrobacter sp. UM1]MCB4207522.1 DUF3054 domain-containing protein [Arthrobacter sp. UM1]
MSTAPRRRWAVQAVLDVVLVLAFAAIGRSSHGESPDPVGILTTAWPFLAGLALGWLVSRSWRAPHALAPAGLTVWLGTLAFGMALRAVTGGGVAVSFIIVAGVFLALVLLGSRAVLGALARREERNPQA